jgi:hypothetical protein
MSECVATATPIADTGKIVVEIAGIGGSNQPRIYEPTTTSRAARARVSMFAGR